MIVNLYEPKGFNREKDWCSLTDGSTMLQIQENVLRVLNAEKDFTHVQFWQYCEAMEAINSNKFLGGSNTIPGIHNEVDAYFGSLGVEDELNYTTLQGGHKYA